jgi:plastocyanin
MIRRAGILRAETLLAALLSGLIHTAPICADQTVQVGPGTTFSPSSVTIAPGEAVIWSFQALHTSTSDASTGPEVWDSGLLSSGIFSHTFTTPGSYPYYCQVHSVPGGTMMNGVVIVAGPAPTATATPPATVTPTVPSATPVPPGTPGPSSSPIPTLDPTGTILFALALAGAGFAALKLAARR